MGSRCGACAWVEGGEGAMVLGLGEGITSFCRFVVLHQTGGNTIQYATGQVGLSWMKFGGDASVSNVKP